MFLLLAILPLLAGIFAGHVATPRVPDHRAKSANLLTHVPFQAFLTPLTRTPQPRVATPARAGAFVA